MRSVVFPSGSQRLSHQTLESEEMNPVWKNFSETKFRDFDVSSELPCFFER